MDEIKYLVWIRHGYDRCNQVTSTISWFRRLRSTSDEYYAEIDKRMRDSFPNKFQDKRQNAQAVAHTASNGQSVKSGRKKTVWISPEVK